MELKLISLKVPLDVLARIDAEAARLGLTRTALLLRPFNGGDTQAALPPPIPPTPRRSVTIVAPARRERTTVIGKLRGPLPASSGADVDTKDLGSITRLKGHWKPR